MRSFSRPTEEEDQGSPMFDGAVTCSGEGGGRGGGGRGRGQAALATTAGDVKVPTPVRMYAELIVARGPRVFGCLLGGMLLFGIVGIIVAATTDFSVGGAGDGFEARGTSIAGPVIVIRDYIPDAERDGTISLNPSGGSRKFVDAAVDDDDDDDDGQGIYGCEYYKERGINKRADENDRRRRRLLGRPGSRDLDLWADNAAETGVAMDAAAAAALEQESEAGAEAVRRQLAPVNWTTAVPYLVDECNAYDIADQSSGKIILVYEPTGKDLFSVDALQAMDEVDQEVREFSYQGDRFNPHICRRTSVAADGNADAGDDAYCCPSRSLCNYAAFVGGHAQCKDITQADVDKLKRHVDLCKPFYDTQVLDGDCWDFDNRSRKSSCSDSDLPENCTVVNGVYDILDALTPTTYRDSRQDLNLEVGRVHTAVDGGDDTWGVELYRKVLADKIDDNLGGAKLVAVELDVKGDLFFRRLLSDSYLIAILWLIVFVLVLVHSGDVFHTAFSFVQLFLAFSTAFTLYVCFGLFFPFLNMACLFLLLGVGCDDIFVITDAFKQSFALLPADTSMVDRMGYVITRSGSAIFVTSFTTAASFLANASSAVTAVKCFGVFAALVTISDFVLAMLFLPVVLVLNHEHFHHQCCGSECNSCSCFDVPVQTGRQRWAERFFQERVAFVVNKGRFVWIAVLLAYIGYMASETSGLSRPTTEELQLFPKGHPMERYQLQYENQFANEVGNDGYWPLVFLWGADDKDNGDPFDPDKRGSLKFRDIDGFDPTAWSYLNKTCYDLYFSEFVDRNVTAGAKSLTCPAIWFGEWMSVSCATTLNNKDADTTSWRTPERNANTGCCDYAKGAFPYTRSELENCLPMWSRTYHDAIDTGLWWDKNDEIVLMAAQVESNTLQSSVYGEIADFYADAADFSDNLLKGAPKSLANGWFTSDYSFFALQRAIASGAVSATVLACCLALAVIFCLTQDIIASVLAGGTIAGIVAAIAGASAIDGWELNVIESIVFSLAVGLSCDFCAHLAHAYVSAPAHLDRTGRVAHALAEMGVSVTMGAITTFAAGACLLNSSVLFYQQFGFFLTTLMTNSWFLSVFLLMSLLAVLGFQANPITLAKQQLFGQKAPGPSARPAKFTEMV